MVLSLNVTSKESFHGTGLHSLSFKCNSYLHCTIPPHCCVITSDKRESVSCYALYWSVLSYCWGDYFRFPPYDKFKAFHRFSYCSALFSILAVWLWVWLIISQPWISFHTYFENLVYSYTVLVFNKSYSVSPRATTIRGCPVLPCPFTIITTMKTHSVFFL